MTKSCLDVLTNLGKAFQSAVKEGPKQPKTVFPYVVQNDTGLVITLMLDKGPFQVRNKTVITMACSAICIFFNFFKEKEGTASRRILMNSRSLRLSVQRAVAFCNKCS